MAENLKLHFLRTLNRWLSASGSFSFPNLLDFIDHCAFIKKKKKKKILAVCMSSIHPCILGALQYILIKLITYIK